MLFAILFCTGSSALMAQDEPVHEILTYFRAQLSGDEVYLNWEIKGGNSCNGIQIYRSTNDTDYVKIGDIQGVCGGTGFPESYNFTDTDPVSNAYNYYRLELGTQGSTVSIKIHYIELENSRYTLYPHPIETGSILYFDNPDNIGYSFKVFNLSGHLIYNRDIATGNQFPIDDLLVFGKGMYVFQLVPENNTTAIRGKILVN